MLRNKGSCGNAFQLLVTGVHDKERWVSAVAERPICQWRNGNRPFDSVGWTSHFSHKLPPAMFLTHHSQQGAPGRMTRLNLETLHFCQWRCAPSSHIYMRDLLSWDIGRDRESCSPCGEYIIYVVHSL